MEGQRLDGAPYAVLPVRAPPGRTARYLVPCSLPRLLQSGRGAAKLIGHVDHYQDVIVDNSMQDNPEPLDAAKFTALAQMNDLMYFRRLRSELRAFLQRHQLSEDAIADDRWPEF